MDTNYTVTDMSSNGPTQFLHSKYLVFSLYRPLCTYDTLFTLFLINFWFNLQLVWYLDWGWQSYAATPHDKHDNIKFSNFTIIISVIDIYDSESGKINL